MSSTASRRPRAPTSVSLKRRCSTAGQPVARDVRALRLLELAVAVFGAEARRASGENIRSTVCVRRLMSSLSLFCSYMYDSFGRHGRSTSLPNDVADAVGLRGAQRRGRVVRTSRPVLRRSESFARVDVVGMILDDVPVHPRRVAMPAHPVGHLRLAAGARRCCRGRAASTASYSRSAASWSSRQLSARARPMRTSFSRSPRAAAPRGTSRWLP